MRISAIDQDLLTLLRNNELYGLEVVKRVNAFRPVQLSCGSVYPALNRLYKKKLISDRILSSSSGGNRRYYKITKLGLEKLEEIETYRERLGIE